jgi:YVTN family beta-propeller protein
MMRVRLVVCLMLVLSWGRPAPAAAQITSRIVSANIDAGTVSVVDLSTRTILATVPVGGSPFGVAISADGRKAYVADLSHDKVSIIDLFDYTIDAVITGFDLPASVALSPDGHTAYVTEYGANRVAIVDLTTLSITSTVAVGASPGDLVVSPDGRSLYVANFGGSTVSRYDLTSGTVVSTMIVGSSPRCLDFTPDGSKLYVANSSGGSVSVIETATNTVVATIPGGGNPVPGVAVNPDGAEAYFSRSGANAVAVVDVATDTVVATITGILNPAAMKVTNDGQYLFVGADGGTTMKIIDLATRTLSGTLTTATFPSGFGGFIGPNMIVASGGPVTIANDAALDLLRFRSHVNFHGGTLALSGDLVTPRAFTMLPDGGTLDTGAFTATLSGDIGGPGVLTKTGAGTLVIAGATTHQKTVVSQGRLVVTGSHTADIELDGGSLSVTGTVGTIIANTASSGVISPGDNGPGELRTAQAQFAADTTLQIELNGPAMGTGYDRLTTTGGTPTVLGGATLSVTLGYTPTAGTAFTIVTNASGAFAGLAEGDVLVLNGHHLRLSYMGGSGNDVVLTMLADVAPSLTGPSDRTILANTTFGPEPFTVGDDWTAPAALIVSASSSNHALVPDANVVPGGSGADRTLTITPLPDTSGVTTITVAVEDEQGQVTTRSFDLTVETRIYYLAEGATGTFFDTDLLLVNPTAIAAPVSIGFLKDDGTRVTDVRTLPPTSRTTLHLDELPGLEAASFSTIVDSTAGVPLAVERTMWWDGATGYGAHTEKAATDLAASWYFAEGSQGFFKTYFLLENPQPTANVAHVTYFREDEADLQREYPLAPSSRLTIDVGSEPELRWRSFGAQVTFDQPGMAERAMYFGTNPLLAGGSAAAGVTAPSTTWHFAEGAVSSFFSTFLLIANPGATDADVTVTYLRDGGEPVVTMHPVAAHQRLTIDVAADAPALGASSFATTIASTQAVVAERSVYWPRSEWTESHSSAGETATGRAWALAEGRVGGENRAQTFVLIANPGADTAEVTVTFLRADGTTLVKQVSVPGQRRTTIAIAGAGSDVPALANEDFGVRLDSTQPIIVERSMYANAGGVTWAAGTNATATRLPEERD